jgi:hypothetical protein
MVFGATVALGAFGIAVGLSACGGLAATSGEAGQPDGSEGGPSEAGDRGVRVDEGSPPPDSNGEAGPDAMVDGASDCRPIDAGVPPEAGPMSCRCGSNEFCTDWVPEPGITRPPYTVCTSLPVQCLPSTCSPTPTCVCVEAWGLPSNCASPESCVDDGGVVVVTCFQPAPP